MRLILVKMLFNRNRFFLVSLLVALQKKCAMLRNGLELWKPRHKTTTTKRCDAMWTATNNTTTICSNLHAHVAYYFIRADEKTARYGQSTWHPSSTSSIPGFILWRVFLGHRPTDLSVLFSSASTRNNFFRKTHGDYYKGHAQDTMVESLLRGEGRI